MVLSWSTATRCTSMSSSLTSSTYASFRSNWRLSARYETQPWRWSRAIAWFRTSSKVMAAPPHRSRVRVEPSALRWSHNRGGTARQYHGRCCRACQERTGSHPWVPCVTLLRDIPGADIAVAPTTPTVCAGAIVLNYTTLAVVERKGTVSTTDFPYIPGLLSFREAP